LSLEDERIIFYKFMKIEKEEIRTFCEKPYKKGSNIFIRNIVLCRYSALEAVLR